MKQYIKRIQQILNNGCITIDWENLKTSFVMDNPASIENIIKCNVYCEQRLPEVYKHFLEHYDGGTLFKYDDIGGFKFLSTIEMINENDWIKKIYEDDWSNDTIVFCKLLGVGEYLGFRFYDNFKYEIVHCFMDQLPDKWPVIGNSFDKFIEILIKEKGKEFWLFKLS